MFVIYSLLIQFGYNFGHLRFLQASRVYQIWGDDRPASKDHEPFPRLAARVLNPSEASVGHPPSHPPLSSNL